jgi:hypothetical protein
MSSKWEDELWLELNAMSPSDRFIATGRVITGITQQLLTELANSRRAAVLEAVDGEGIDAVTFAERVGSGSSAIKRLLDEARAKSRRALH